MKIKVCMTIDNEVYRNYKAYCESNGFKISTRVEVLMKKDLTEKYK